MRTFLLLILSASLAGAATYARHADVHLSGIPLGGMGAGTIELRSDGLLHDWGIFNHPTWYNEPDAHPEVGAEDAGFAVWMKKTGAPPVVRHLSIRGGQQVAGQRDHEMLWYNLYLLPWLKTIDRIDYTGEFPFARLEYHSEGMPLRVSLEAFSPFIPHDATESALPGAYFTFTLENPTSDEYDVSLLSILKNFVAYDVPVASKEGRIEVEESRDWTALHYACDGVDPASASVGTMSLACLDGERSWLHGYMGSFNPLPSWNSAMFFWPKYRATGRLPSAVETDRRPHEWTETEPWHGGALASRVHLAPGEKRQIRFVLTWHFPNNPPDEDGSRAGHIYSRWYGSSGDVLAHMRTRRDELHARTLAFHDALYNSKLDYWLKDAINAQLAVLTKLSWWTADDVFSIWEGYGTFGPASPIDVMYYGDIPVALLFPELDINILKNQYMRRNRKDCQPQYVMWAYRSYVWTGDRAFLDERWPVLVNQMEYAKERDLDGDGITDNAGADTSYDNFRMYGTSAYVGFIELAALRSMVEIAKLRDDANAVEYYQDWFEKAKGSVESRLWNGKYYDLYNDPGGKGRSNCCMADQLNGQWFAHQANLGYLVDPARVKSALASVYRINRGPEEGLINGVWPDESSVYPNSEHFPSHINWTWATPWTGTEYAVAMHMIEEGMVDEGLAIAKDAYDRYDIGMTWNHIECGGWYSRAPVVWGLLLALQGWKYDAPSQSLTLDPVLHADDFDTLFVLPTGWGRIRQTRAADGSGQLEIHLSSGALSLRSITVGLTGSSAKVVDGSGRELKARADAVGKGTRFLFEKSEAVRGGETLLIEARP